MNYRRLWRRLSAPGGAAVAHGPRRTSSVDAETRQRQDAETILRSAVQGADAGEVVRERLQSDPPTIGRGGRLLVVAVGHAAIGMARAADLVLGDRIDEAIALVPGPQSDAAPSRFESFRGGWPLPDEASVAGARAVASLARESASGDCFLTLVSGGGESLLTLPPERVDLDSVRRLTEALLRRGLSGSESSRVRRHADRLQAGRMARLVAPARLRTIVVANAAPAEEVSGGPMLPDVTRYADALAVLRSRGLLDRVPRDLLEHFERGVRSELRATPGPSDPCFAEARASTIDSPSLSLDAALESAERLGYDVRVLDEPLPDEAARAGTVLGAAARRSAETAGLRDRPRCLLSAGRSLRTDRGDGRGGGNQALALGAVEEIDGIGTALVASMATSGHDGVGDAAGAIVTATTGSRARELGLRPASEPASRDPYVFFERLDDLIRSGPTGTDAGDLQVILVDASR